jgi:hypothetical protein
MPNTVRVFSAKDFIYVDRRVKQYDLGDRCLTVTSRDDLVDYFTLPNGTTIKRITAKALFREELLPDSQHQEPDHQGYATDGQHNL